MIVDGLETLKRRGALDGPEIDRRRRPVLCHCCDSVDDQGFDDPAGRLCDDQPARAVDPAVQACGHGRASNMRDQLAANLPGASRDRRVKGGLELAWTESVTRESCAGRPTTIANTATVLRTFVFIVKPFVVERKDAARRPDSTGAERFSEIPLRSRGERHSNSRIPVVVAPHGQLRRWFRLDQILGSLKPDLSTR